MHDQGRTGVLREGTNAVPNPGNIDVCDEIQVVGSLLRFVFNPGIALLEQPVAPDARCQQVCVAEQNSVGISQVHPRMLWPRAIISMSSRWTSPLRGSRCVRAYSGTKQVWKWCARFFVSVDFPVDSGPKMQTRFAKKERAGRVRYSQCRSGLFLMSVPLTGITLRPMSTGTNVAFRTSESFQP